MAKFSTFLLAASMMTAGIAAPAAANDDGSKRVAVHYDDLNLSSTADRERLSLRVARAVRQVCAVEPLRDLRLRAQSQECQKHTMRTAEVQLANLLSANRVALAGGESILLIRP